MFALHLWCGGAAAGRSAAALHDLRSFNKDTLEVCTNRNLDRPDGVILARLSPRAMPPTVPVDGIPTTAVEPTILRLAASVGARRAGIALDDALRRGLTTTDSMNAYVEEAAVQGRNGISRTRQLLETRDRRYEQLRGESENEMIPLFDGIRLPFPEVDYEIWSQGRLIAVADFAYPSVRLDIEADTKSFHSGYSDQRHDKRRDRSLASIGWRVLRFDREEIVGEPWRVVGDIRAVLRELDASVLSA